MEVNGKTEVLSRGENIYMQKKDQMEITELKEYYMKKKNWATTEWAQQQNGDGEIRVSEFEIR